MPNIVASIKSMSSTAATDSRNSRTGALPETVSKQQFISCTGCRTRKVKCTGERPECVNCTKKGHECHYDKFVRRRGPDKEPGGRLKPRGAFGQRFANIQRSNGPRLSLAALTPGQAALAQRQRQQQQQQIALQIHHQQQAAIAAAGQKRKRSKASKADQQHQQEHKMPPKLNDGAPNTTTGGVRDPSPNGTCPHPKNFWTILFEYMPFQDVTAHCQYFLSDTSLWYNFFHPGLSLQALFTRTLAPHTVCAVLAHTTLLKDGHTRTGQLRALHFAAEARTMLSICLNRSVIDPSMVQTSVLLVAFEFQPHIRQNLARATAALAFSETCATVARDSWGRHFKRPVSSVAGSPSEDVSAIRQEELRQMCWTLSQLSNSMTIWRLLTDQPPINLATADPTRFKSILPLDKTSPGGYKDSGDNASWMLYFRSVCLWHAALNHELDHQQHLTVTAQARAVESAVDMPCSPAARKYTWEAAEWAVAARGCLGDLENRTLRTWFRTQQAALINFSQRQATKESTGTANGSSNGNVKSEQGADGEQTVAVQQPAYTWWFMMVAYTAIRILEHAPAFLVEAEAVLESVFGSLDAMTVAWPCPTLEHCLEVLRRHYATVKAACESKLEARVI